MTITGTYVLTRRTCTSTFASEHIPPHRQGYISMILLSTNLTAEPSGADPRNDYDSCTRADSKYDLVGAVSTAQSHSKADRAVRRSAHGSRIACRARSKLMLFCLATTASS